MMAASSSESEYASAPASACKRRCCLRLRRNSGHGLGLLVLLLLSWCLRIGRICIRAHCSEDGARQRLTPGWLAIRAFTFGEASHHLVRGRPAPKYHGTDEPVQDRDAKHRRPGLRRRENESRERVAVCPGQCSDRIAQATR